MLFQFKASHIFEQRILISNMDILNNIFVIWFIITKSINYFKLNSL